VAVAIASSRSICAGLPLAAFTAAFSALALALAAAFSALASAFALALASRAAALAAALRSRSSNSGNVTGLCGAKPWSARNASSAASRAQYSRIRGPFKNVAIEQFADLAHAANCFLKL